MHKLNILFLGGGKRVSIAEHFINIGKNLNFDVHVFSYELNEQVPLASVGTIIIGLKWNDTEIIDHLRRVAIEYGINIIVPFVDPAVKIASVLHTKLLQLYIPVCSPELCDIMYDKLAANKWFIDRNFPVPQHDFPLIAKPRNGSASKGILKIENAEELNKFEEKFDRDRFLIQHFIDGNEYTVDCYVAQNGIVIGCVPRIRIETSGGEVVRTRTINHKEIIKLSNEILLNKGFNGPITLQFIEDKITKEIFVMEINPRFGGGVLATINAGADYVWKMLEEYQSIAISPITFWKENFLMTRYFKEVYFDADNN